MIKTAYSFNTAVGQLEEVASRLKEIGWQEGPIADRGNTFGWVKWSKTCKETGLRPIYGAEIGVQDNIAEKRPNIDYWTLLAMDDVASLNELVSEATSNPGKEPTLTYQRLMQAKGVLKIAHERCLSDNVDWKRNDVFPALSPATPMGLYREVIGKGGCLVALPRNTYPRESDLEFYRVALGSFRASTQTYAQHIVSDDEWREAVWFADEIFASTALANRQVLLDRCQAELKQAKLLPFPKTKPLKQLCLEGATKLGVCLNEIYKSRLDKELAMIAEKNFEDYFYIIADIVAYAKQEMVVGPARGSSCGSLVCYLLGITSVDPMAHGLLFERFIDITRADLPDIDLDFSHTKRHMVFEYAEKKYGANCSRLGSVGTFQGASSLNQVAQALMIPRWMSDNVSETLIQRKMGDSRASSTIADTLQDTDAGRALLKNYPEARIVERFEDHPRNASQHAAGLIVTDKPVDTYVAIDGKTRVAMCDKYDAEALNLLKIDILGLIQLSIFERVMELIGIDPVSGWLEKIPLDDPDAFMVVNQGKFCGLFQLTGRATRLLCTQIKFDKFDDVVAVNALSRPGPAVSGGMERWVARRAGFEPVTYPHPVFEPVLRDTYGVVCFQEQILQIGREVGDLSWAEVTALRKAMSRSLGEEYFNQFGDKWKQGALAKGVPQLVADSFWVSMCLDANTKIRLQKKSKPLTIKQLYQKYESNPTYEIERKGSRPSLVSLFPDGRGHLQKALKIIKSGKKLCWKYVFEDDSYVVCTPDHRFIINGGWWPIGKAKIGDDFAFMGNDYKKHGARARGHTGKGKGSGKRDSKGRFFDTGRTVFAIEYRKEMFGKACVDCGEHLPNMNVHHNDFVEGRKRPMDVAWLCSKCHRTRHWQSGHGATPAWGVGKAVTTKRLIKRQKLGLRDVYDISMPKHHNFTIQNGLITHNCQYGSWAFNRSHSVAYAYVSYWCMYLKAHHPVEFAAATLDAEKNIVKQIEILRELRDEGVDYIPVDPELSTDRWEIVEGPDNSKKLLGPLTNIDGIGPVKVATILSCRKNGERLPGKALQSLLEPPVKTRIDSLYPLKDWLDRTYPDGMIKIQDEQGRNWWSPQTAFIPLAELQKIELTKGDWNSSESVLVLGTPDHMGTRDVNDPIAVAKRGYKLEDPTWTLSIFFRDDTDQVHCKVGRFEFKKMGRPMQERGKAGKAVYAIRGNLRQFDDGFRSIEVTMVYYLGDMSGMGTISR